MSDSSIYIEESSSADAKSPVPCHTEEVCDHHSLEDGEDPSLGDGGVNELLSLLRDSFLLFYQVQSKKARLANLSARMMWTGHLSETLQRHVEFYLKGW